METNMQNSNQKSHKGLKFGATAISALAIGGLIAGGGTLALWNDSVTTEQYDIQAGNLAMEQIGKASVTDANGTDVKGQTIAPGEEITIRQEFDIALEGHNLFAAVETNELQEAVQSANLAPEGEERITPLNVSSSVLDAEGNTLPGNGTSYLFASSGADTSDNPGLLEPDQVNVAGESLDDTADLVVEYTVEFDQNVAEGQVATEDLIGQLNAVDLTIRQQL